MLKIAVCDDDEKICNLLENYINDSCRILHIEAETESFISPCVEHTRFNEQAFGDSAKMRQSQGLRNTVTHLHSKRQFLGLHKKMCKRRRISLFLVANYQISAYHILSLLQYIIKMSETSCRYGTEFIESFESNN